MSLTQIDHDQYGGHVRVSFTSLANSSGAARSTGEVVVQDAGAANSFTTTTTQGDTRPVFVVVDTSIASNATGYVAGYGIVTVNVQGNVALGSYLRTSATVGRAEDAGSTVVAGVFARALTSFTGSSGSVTALLFGVTLAAPAAESGTWVNASRSKDTVYQNTSGKARRVMGKVDLPDGNNRARIDVGSGNPPTTVQFDLGPNAAIGNTITLPYFFIVPNNWYYQIATGIGTIALGTVYEMDE